MSACEKALQVARSSKIDECEAILSKRRTITIRITDSRISEIKENHDESLGIRLVDKKRILSAQTDDFRNIDGIIQKTINSSSSIKPKPFWRSLPSPQKFMSIENTFDPKISEISPQEVVDLAQTMIDKASHSKISKVTGSLNIVSEEFILMNSNNLEIKDDATYISGLINADSEFGAEPVSGIGQHCCRTLNSFDAENIGNDAKEMCIGSINPVKPQDGNYSIIFDPYSVGEILAFVAAANFNLKTYAEKKSCFTEKIGKKIASESFTLADNPHAPQGIGTKPFDDEGVPTRKNFLIQNGVFQNTFSDLYDAFKEETYSSGNASRAASPMGRNSEPIPISAPHNMEIQKGRQSQEDMIKDAKNGLLVGRLWYTYAINPIRGDFSCTARSGVRLIKNGNIIPCKSVRIVHNFPLMLENISAIGNNSKNVLQWASLPSITPSIKVENIRIIAI